MLGMGSTRLSRPSPATAKSTTVPACTAGVNALSGFMEMGPTDCIWTYNLMPVEYGMRLRKGYREWATGINGAVRTVLTLSLIHI